MSTIDYCNAKQIPAVIISLDLEKAFDKVIWSSLIKILKFFNFGPNFCQMVEMLYLNTSSCTTSNGYSSKYFQLECALRQRCPYNSPAFLLIAEILGLKIKQNKKIEGITLPNKIGWYEKQKKLAQYANDLWVSLKADEQCIEEFFKEIDMFVQNTGLKVNYNKTQIMRIGSIRDSNAKFYAQRKLIWSDCVRILGIDVYSHPEKSAENYSKTISKIKAILELWSLRALTPIGKIAIINTLAVLQFVYKLFVLPMPNNKTFTEIKSVFKEFIWGKKQPKIAYSTLVQPINKGGLKLADLEV